jgi:asparagine synthase (glutamine-hydrolysing)
MCGIAGLINYSNAQQTLTSMLSTIAHRGPDSEGLFFSSDNTIALGHRRLSIIDLSLVSNQPFIKDEWVLVFNGEIYNFHALKKELMALGATFRTQSDTEVLLESWRQWGSDCLNKLRGMFAFALYNQKTKQLFLARDPFGIKPLFIYQKNNQLAFASELKALTPLIDNKTINYSALAASLLYVWIPDSQCMFQDVIKFPPGHWAEVSDNAQLHLKTYYSLTNIMQARTRPFSVDNLESILLDSVEKHLIADVPVSTFLSGGLDSSLLTAMAKSKTDRVDSYTITFRQSDQESEAMPDDARYAKQLSEKLGIKLHNIEITPDVVSLLPQSVKMLDEPIGDAAAINTFLICQAARQAGVKVLLSGMGADEIFAGYRKHYACMLAHRYQKIPAIMREKLISPIVNRLPVAGKNKGYRFSRWAKRFVQFANLPEEQRFLRSYSYYSQQEMSQLLMPDFQRAINPVFDEHAEIYRNNLSNDSINRMCATDIQLFMLGLNLTYTDRASMAASTEVRVPFIDRDVIQAAMQMPGKQKLHGRTGKYLLKKVAEKWLPHNIIYRPKAGFGAPLRSWIRHDLRDHVNTYILGDQGLLNRGFLNANTVRNMVQADRDGKADYSQQIWQFLTLEMWLRENKL